MGWTGHELKDGHKLYTRGGTNGVFVKTAGGEQIDIPAEMLLMLVADEVRMRRFEELESMSDCQVLGLVFSEGIVPTEG